MEILWRAGSPQVCHALSRSGDPELGADGCTNLVLPPAYWPILQVENKCSSISKMSFRYIEQFLRRKSKTKISQGVAHGIHGTKERAVCAILEVVVGVEGEKCMHRREEAAPDIGEELVGVEAIGGLQHVVTTAKDIPGGAGR